MLFYKHYQQQHQLTKQRNLLWLWKKSFLLFVFLFLSLISHIFFWNENFDSSHLSLPQLLNQSQPQTETSLNQNEVKQKQTQTNEMHKSILALKSKISVLRKQLENTKPLPPKVFFLFTFPHFHFFLFIFFPFSYIFLFLKPQNKKTDINRQNRRFARKYR
jgi:hypothetical protein